MKNYAVYCFIDGDTKGGLVHQCNSELSAVSWLDNRQEIAHNDDVETFKREKCSQLIINSNTLTLTYTVIKLVEID